MHKRSPSPLACAVDQPARRLQDLVDPNATPIVMFRQRVATSNLPTFPAGGTSLPVVPTVPLPSSVVPTLVLPTQPAFTHAAQYLWRQRWSPPLMLTGIRFLQVLDWRVINFRAPSSTSSAVLVTRIDPRYARFKVYYQAGAVRNIQQWQSAASRRGGNRQR
ncbi:MAG: hypothetical protein U0528_04400 [Anaerolineae bacterium]